MNTFFVDSEFGFSGIAGLAHQVSCGTGNLSPASNWTDASQSNSAPSTANINYVQTQSPHFLLSAETKNSSNSILHGAKEQTDDKQACVVLGNRPGALKQQTTEEKIIIEEQENEDEVNTDLQCGENHKGFSVAESRYEECHGYDNSNMQQEGRALELQSKVVIENADEQSIRFPQKTEDQLQTQSDISHCIGSTLAFPSNSESQCVQQQDVRSEEKSGSSHVNEEVQSECCGNHNLPVSSPPVSPNYPEGMFSLMNL